MRKAQRCAGWLVAGDHGESRLGEKHVRGPRGKVGATVAALGKDVDAAGVARVALAAGVPTMFEYRFYVDAGGLASYRLNWDQQTRRAAAHRASLRKPAFVTRPSSPGEP